jgi:hypothetical protein
METHWTSSLERDFKKFLWLVFLGAGNNLYHSPTFPGLASLWKKSSYLDGNCVLWRGSVTHRLETKLGVLTSLLASTVISPPEQQLQPFSKKSKSTCSLHSYAPCYGLWQGESQACWQTAVTPAVRRQKQEDLELKVSLGYLWDPISKTKTKKQNKYENSGWSGILPSCCGSELPKLGSTILLVTCNGRKGVLWFICSITISSRKIKDHIGIFQFRIVTS